MIIISQQQFDMLAQWQLLLVLEFHHQELLHSGNQKKEDITISYSLKAYY